MENIVIVDLGNGITVNIVPSDYESHDYRYDIYDEEKIVGAFGLTEHLTDAKELRAIVMTMEERGALFDQC